MTYTPTIGLEIHAELNTATKMFCNSKNDARETRPNVNICPVCLAHPGTLPVINREAVHHVLRVGTALGGKIADYTEFDRKNYFYPDLPKGYQISQYAYPLISGGSLDGVALTRIHLEEDTASSIHDPETGATLVDFNRSGVPLMELVTEPVIHTAEDAGHFGRELQLLLRYLGASEADMEKGHMRLEANISVSNSDVLGTKVEVKNINSFRAMERAIRFEIERQTKLLEKGESVSQETRGWDDVKQMTFAQRIKEGAADYRYFPDPDLPSCKLSEIEEFALHTLQASLPELPANRRARYESWGIKKEDADQFTGYPVLGDFLDQVAGESATDIDLVKTAANYIANDLASIIRDIDERDTKYKGKMPISAENFKKIITMVRGKKITSRVAKDVLLASIREGKDPEAIAMEENLFASDAMSLAPVVAEVLAAHAEVVLDYKKGKEAALQFLVGQSMRILKGAADPLQLKDEILKQLVS